MRISVLLLFVSAVTANEIIFPKNSATEDSRLKGMAYNVANLGLKTLRDLFGEENLIVSPFNIYSVLGILDLGASGETKEEIHEVLGQINFSRPTVIQTTESETISYASALFLDHTFVPRPEFTTNALAKFDAPVIQINTTEGIKSKDIINSWVADHTNQTITNLLQDPLNPSTRMVIVSALLFNGKWLHSFSSAFTQLGKFAIKDGLYVEVPLMHVSESFPLIRNSLLDAVSLPYKGDRGMNMHIVLPKVHGLQQIKKILSHLNVNSLKKLRKESQEEEIVVIIPKMKIEGRVSLSDTLNKQGLKTMFDPVRANFSAATEDSYGLFVSEIYHSIHFEMDESGTSASAASAPVMTKSRKFTFLVNRPFIFIITDESDLILFMGVITNPLA